jgi:ribonuclease Z
MRVHFLGTSAGTPTPRRNVTAQAVVFDHGAVWLLDCGEGTQHRLLRSAVRASRVERILITHLHGDHCYGLPGLLAFLAIQGRKEPVELVGPVGLRELVETVARLSLLQLGYPLRITEIAAAGDLPGSGGWSLAVRPLTHRITCWGYILREGRRPGVFHPAKAEALGVPEGRLWGVLQRGGTVTLEDGRTVEPRQVADPPRPGRTLALLGDTSDADAIADAAQGCDLLVCEATYDASRAAKAVEWGHMTAAGAGALAARLHARTLVITHFSQRYEDEAGIAALRAEAAAACPGTRVLAARDRWSVAVPLRRK